MMYNVIKVFKNHISVSINIIFSVFFLFSFFLFYRFCKHDIMLFKIDLLFLINNIKYFSKTLCKKRKTILSYGKSKVKTNKQILGQNITFL